LRHAELRLECYVNFACFTRVVRVGEECGTLFLIGPRRFGKTSILRAAEAKLTDSHKVVLRYDAEAFDDIGTLAAALSDGRRRHLTAVLVDEALGRVVSMQHVGYLQRWLPLTRAQKQTLRIVSEEPIGFELATTARRHGLPRTTMQRGLEALERQHFLRQDLAGTTATRRFEDPFMRSWLATLEHQ
jgi:hypothetical protein